MTLAERNTYIVYLQSLYKDKWDKYLDSLKLGRECPNLELKLLMSRQYINAVYCYTPFDQEVTYAYRFAITREGEGDVEYTITIGTDTIVYSGDGDLEEILDYFEDQLEASSDYDFEVEIIDSILYVWSYDDGLAFDTLTEVSVDSEDEGDTIEAINMQNTYSCLLNHFNCLTNCEICRIINSALDLLNNCNC